MWRFAVYGRAALDALSDLVPHIRVNLSHYLSLLFIDQPNPM
jgi:hypothetical protein